MSKIKPVRKAVFPVAGLGTRFLPATKSVPKEMLTIVDRPVIQYIVEEAREAGIEAFLFVTGRSKSVIEDHFDSAFELEKTLVERGKTDALELLRKGLPVAGAAMFTRQQEPLGLGHAVWCARHLVGDEPFALLLPDMLMQSQPGCLSRMMEVYNRVGGNIISTEEVAWEETHKYGVVVKGESIEGGFKVEGMVEKPEPGTAPSNLFINGRYILQPEIFPVLEEQKPGAGGEIQITDAMLRLAESQAFHGFTFRGRTFDCGSKSGFVAANLAYGLGDPEIGESLGDEIRGLVK